MANGANNSGWMEDVQRALALGLVITFCVSLLLVMVRLVVWGDPPTMIDVAKLLLNALINVVMLVLGYFYGSSKAKEQSDTSTQRMMEKMTPAAPPPPAAPPAAVIAAWWGKLTEEEKTAITAAAPADARVSAFMTASAVSTATPDDLAYLVSKGLLTQARADEIKGP